jgi:hypothetical protein
MSEITADFDNTWKEALSEFFPEFLSFFFPRVYHLIDWEQTPQPLDKELQRIAPSDSQDKRIADKLFQVWLQDKQEIWLLVHIEVQSQEEDLFSQRMYIYNYRVFDLYKRPVISLAILGDEKVNWRPNSFGYEYGGCELSLKFPIAKLLDYESQWGELEQDSNPFAVIIMAHLKTKRTLRKYPEREQWKWQLVRGLYDKGYNRQQITTLFKVIDKMMALPRELQESFDQKLRQYEEQKRMPLLSNMEERGLNRGRQEGELKNAHQWLLQALETRFGVLSPTLTEQINNLSDMDTLTNLFQRAIVSNSLEEFLEGANLLDSHP